MINIPELTPYQVNSFNINSSYWCCVWNVPRQSSLHAQSIILLKIILCIDMSHVMNKCHQPSVPPSRRSRAGWPGRRRPGSRWRGRWGRSSSWPRSWCRSPGRTRHHEPPAPCSTPDTYITWDTRLRHGAGRTFTLLELENCPRDSSMKYRGLPIMIRTTRYGIKNAPPPFS